MKSSSHAPFEAPNGLIVASICGNTQFPRSYVAPTIRVGHWACQGVSQGNTTWDEVALSKITETQVQETMTAANAEHIRHGVALQLSFAEYDDVLASVSNPRINVIKTVATYACSVVQKPQWEDADIDMPFGHKGTRMYRICDPYINELFTNEAYCKQRDALAYMFDRMCWYLRQESTLEMARLYREEIASLQVELEELVRVGEITHEELLDFRRGPVDENCEIFYEEIMELLGADAGLEEIAEKTGFAIPHAVVEDVVHSVCYAPYQSLLLPSVARDQQRKLALRAAAKLDTGGIIIS